MILYLQFHQVAVLPTANKNLYEEAAHCYHKIPVNSNLLQ